MNFPVVTDIKGLAEVLSALYLGPVATYTIHFAPMHLADIEKIFDGLIFQHGVRPVQFTYRIGHSRKTNQKLDITIECAAAALKAS